MMIRMLGYALLAVHLSLLLFQDARADSPIPASSPAKSLCGLCTILDTPRDYLSDKFLSLSDRLDMFFSNTTTFENLNKSFAELSVNAVTTVGEYPNYYGDTRVFLAMPRTQKRLNLMFQSENDGELDPDNPDITPGSPDQKTTALALRGSVRKSQNWRLFADIGTENRGFLDPFFRLTYYQMFGGKKWTWDWREAIFRFSYRGNGITSGLGFDREISQKYHLRLFNQVIWYQTDNYYDRTHSLNLYQIMQHHNASSYSVGFYTTTNPTPDSVYFLQYRYKKLIHKTWLFYEVIPEVLYMKSTLYSATPRLTLKLDIMLGNP